MPKEEVKLISLRIKSRLNKGLLAYGAKYGLTRTAIIEMAVERFLGENLEYKTFEQIMSEHTANHRELVTEIEEFKGILKEAWSINEEAT